MKTLRSEELSTAASAIGCSGDLLPEILIRLPARDLIRLKSVSTQWNRIISDPLFAARHTQNSGLRLPAGAILYDPYRSSRPFKTVPVQIFGNPPTSVPSLSFMRNIIADFDYSCTRIESCNGLLLCLFSQKIESVLDLQSLCFVCNPTTRAFKLLPHTSMMLCWVLRLSNLRIR